MLTRFVAALVVLALTLAACGGEEEKGVLQSIPADAVLLGSVQLQRALLDKDIEESFAQLAGFVDSDDATTLDEALEEAQKESGIDFKAVQEVLFFASELADADFEEAEGAAFSRGAHDQTAILAAAEAEGPVELTTYKGQELHTSSDNETFAFLTEELFVLGSLEGVKAVIDVRAGDAKALSGELRDSFTAMGDPLLKLVFLPPAGLLEEALAGVGEFGVGDLPIDLSLFTQFRSLGFSVDKAGEELAFELTLGYPEETQASDAQEGLGGLLSFVKVSSDSPELSEFLDKVEVTSRDRDLVIAATFSLDEFDVSGGSSEEEAIRVERRVLSDEDFIELQNVHSAVIALMTDHGIRQIDTPVAATNDMTAFPATVNNAGETTVAGSKDGYLLRGHDKDKSDGVEDNIHYVAFDTTRCLYSVDTSATVTQTCS